MNYTYNMLLDDCNMIIQTIKLSNWTPDLVAGITRGGLIPATIISHRLNIPMETLDWSARDWKKKNIPMRLKLEVDYMKKKVLIVDDIVDNGETMKQVKQYFSNEVKTAALIYNHQQELHMPNYYGRIIDRSVDKDWVNFWWELK